MSKWKKVEKELPDTERRVIAWRDTDACLAIFKDGTWWTGTFVLGGVTRWMDLPGMPKDLGYWIKKVKSLWSTVEEKSNNTVYNVTGWAPRNAQLSKKPTFFVNRSTGEVMTGGPEHINAPHGYERVVCTKAYEAEQWSERQRQFDRSKHGRMQEQRASVEEPIHAEIRSEMHNRMANARNATNREFMRRALEMSDKKHSPWKYERESYMHAEGYEDKR